MSKDERSFEVLRHIEPRTPLDTIFDPTIADMVAQHERWFREALAILAEVRARLEHLEKQARNDERPLRPVD